MEHRGKLLRTENILVILQLHGTQPERNRNAGQSDQHHILCYENTALSGRNIFKIQDRKCTGISVCP